MNKKSSLTPEAVSRYLPQFFVGLFFLSAGYLKAVEGLFGPYRTSLSAVLQYWMDSHLTPEFYGYFLRLIIPYADYFAIAVIALQAGSGILLILNRYTRFAGALIIFVQLNVYLATYLHLELRVLNSQAILLGIYYCAKPEMKGRLWSLFTYGVATVFLLHLGGRFVFFKDHLLSMFPWQRDYFAAYVMSSWPGLKYFVLWLTSGSLAAYVWASFWWIKAVLLAGMLTRYRLYAGIVWLVLAFLITMVWLNTWACEGVLWVLIMFVWTTHEHFQRKSDTKPLRLLFP